MFPPAPRPQTRVPIGSGCHGVVSPDGQVPRYLSSTRDCGRNEKQHHSADTSKIQRHQRCVHGRSDGASSGPTRRTHSRKAHRRKRLRRAQPQGGFGHQTAAYSRPKWGFVCLPRHARRAPLDQSPDGSCIKASEIVFGCCTSIAGQPSCMTLDTPGHVAGRKSSTLRLVDDAPKAFELHQLGPKPACGVCMNTRVWERRRVVAQRTGSCC